MQISITNFMRIEETDDVVGILMDNLSPFFFAHRSLLFFFVMVRYFDFFSENFFILWFIKNCVNGKKFAL